MNSKRTFIDCIIVVLIASCFTSAEAGITCYNCHGSTPSDYRPIDSPVRDPATGGFPGNHRTHMDSTATTAQCDWCHPGSSSYTTGHMNGLIKVGSHMKGSSLVTTYKNFTSSFPQTSSSSGGSCANVNCHFERATPHWGSPRLSPPGGCSTCHGAPPSGGDTGAAGSHYRHDLYYPGAASCGQCHTDHLSETAPFAHATSAAARPLSLVLRDPKGSSSGVYNGSRINYLPKSQTKTFGTCSNTYCHSTGTAVATGAVAANTTVAWGHGALTCDRCHGNPPRYVSGSPKANSHAGHSVTHPLKCNACHGATTADGVTISGFTRHVNGMYDVSPGPGVTFDYTYASTGGSCTNISCHTDATWGETINGGTGCDSCHGHSPGFECAPGKFSQGKGSWRSHATHTQADGANVRGPGITCEACHDLARFPYFKAGTDTNRDGRISLDETTVCDTCHSPGGAFNGVGDAVIGARSNWKFSIYSGNSLRSGKADWCLSCHDSNRALITGRYAPNKAGDGRTYGYNVTGHGRPSSFPRLSLADSATGGNPGAGRGCMDCHDSAMRHINSGLTGNRLKSGYESDRKNTNCVQCHKQGGIADHSPRWFTTFISYSASAHGKTRCRDCHEVHGSSGPYAGMTRADKENLCYLCHRSGQVENDPLSATALPNNIQAVFTMATSFKHDLGAAMNVNGKEYRLQCASCHNVHIVTGRYTSVTVGKTPVTRFGSFTTLWGAVAGQKMDDYAGAQTYQAPKGEFAGSIAPDYATFCTDCHNAANTIFSPSLNRNLVKFNWRAEKHGSYLAKDNQPTFSEMTSPFRDNRLGSYVMSCTDCHEAHGSKNRFMTRTVANEGSVGGITTGAGKQWSALCSKCHKYISYSHHSQENASNRCLECHAASDGSSYKPCTDCHAHRNIDEDETAPAASGLSPANGATGVPVTGQLQVTLADSESGIDWSTFSITLSGNKGYSRTYGAPSSRVAKTNGVSSVAVTVSPDAVFGSVEVITATVSVKDFAGNPLAPPAWAFTSRDISRPSAPTMGIPAALSATSIRWNFTDKSSNEDGFKVHDASHTVKAIREIPDLTFVDETGLSPNTQYTRHVHSYNYGSDSNGSSNGSRYTLSAAPNVTANKTAGAWYTTSTVVFTNAAGFGAGGVQYYRYVWDQNLTYAFNDTETQWSSGTLTKTSTSDGKWYLHIKTYNAENAANGTADYGPFGYDSTPPPQVNIINSVTPSYQDAPPVYGLTTTWYRSADAGSGTVGYKLERAPDVNGAPGTFSLLMDWPDGGNTQVTDTTCATTTRYWYRVRAYDAVGLYGPYSATVSGVTYSPPPGNVTATDGSYADKIVISWTQSGSSGGFTVYRNYPSHYAGSIAVCSVPQGTTACTDTVSGVYTYYVYANYNQAYPVSDIGFTSGAFPSAPTAGTPESLSGTSIRWRFNDNAPNETGFRLHDSGNAVKASQASPNIGYLEESSLAANTRYIRHVHAYNGNGESAATTDITAWTLSPAPSVSANRATGIWSNDRNITFTNNLSFGPGAIGSYRYLLSQSSIYYPGYSENAWTTGQLPLTLGSGMWYLHVTSLNDGGFAGTTVSYGPFNIDLTAPFVIYAESPFRNASYVPATSKVSVPLSEYQSGVDQSTVTVQIRGSKGYSKDYAATSPLLTFSGDQWTTTVNVSPDAPFGTQEIITVTVQARDKAGNSRSHFWSFTTT